jgi:hypothetical protein
MANLSRLRGFVQRGEETCEEYSKYVCKVHTHLSEAGHVDRVAPRFGTYGIALDGLNSQVLGSVFMGMKVA